MSFLNNEHRTFGLDLSDVSIKLMQLKKTGNGYNLMGATDYAIPRGVIVNDNIMNEDTLINYIHAALKKPTYGSIEGHQIVASIPESKAFVRVLTIPKMTEAEAVNAVPFEAEQYIPMPLDQTYYDWQILVEHDGKMDVLITACPREYIDNMLRIYKRAGLQPVAFEVESAACARALVAADKKDKSVLVMDIATFRTSLIVVENNNLQFTSSVPIAGDTFAQAIAKKLGVKVEEAETMKREFGLDDSKEHQDIKEALSVSVDALIVEVINAIKFHDEHSTNPISQIILCGGSSRMLHLNSYLYQKLSGYSQIDILLGNPFVNIFPQGVGNTPAPMPREESLSYTTAAGLALRGANITDLHENN